MSLKSILVAALLVGTSSAVFAAPARDHRTEYTTYANIRDHRSQQVIQQPYYPSYPGYETPAPAWTTQNGFVTVGTFRNAFQGTKTVELGCEGRFVNTLRIFSADQNSVIWNVTVHYADGTQHTYLWNHQFNDSTDGQTGPYLRMGIGGKTITRVDVDATNASRSPMQVQVA